MHHEKGSDNFRYNTTDLPEKLDFHPTSARYFLESKLELLDQDEEWYYDPETKELYLWYENSGELRGKTQDYAYKFYNS